MLYSQDLKPVRTLDASQIAASLEQVAQNLAQQTDIVLDDFERSCLEKWLTRVLARCEGHDGPPWTAIAEQASTAFLALSGKSSDLAETLDRTFQLAYQPPFGPASKLHVAIKDETFVIGSQTWNSAPVLAQRLAARPLHFFGHLASPASHTPAAPTSTDAQPRRTLRVLELGSGTGLVGIAAAMVLSRLLQDLNNTSHHVELLLTDFHADVLANLARNVEANRPAFAHPRLDVRVERLDWTEMDGSAVQGAFDVILGSDLVYEEIHACWVADAVERYLVPSQKPRVLSPAVSPYPSRPGSPSPSPAAPIDLPAPKFHMLLPLRPTFLKESQATHKAFNSTYKPLAGNADIEGPSRSGSNTPISHRETRLTVRKCEVLQGLAISGQGCRNYQLLTIQRA